MYMLDTNMVSYLLKRLPEVERRYDVAVLTDEVALPSIVYYEAIRGLLSPERTRQREIFVAWLEGHSVIPLDLATLDVAARLYNTLRQTGQLIEDADLLIAATALQHDAVLVTNNPWHFSRIPGLRSENWRRSEQ